MGLTSEELRNHLVQKVPVYMIPQDFVFLDKLPLNANGKVNRLLLPKPDGTIRSFREITQPRNGIEIQLADMWSEALGVKQISIHDSFFALGGHSLKAMALCARILKELHVDVPISQFFEAPTIAGIADYLQRAGKKSNGSQHPSQLGITVFNRTANRNLFAFPPVLGYGIMFNDLAKQLPEFRIHAFDFKEEDDRISHYANLLNKLRPEGSFTLLGYSAGCGLAFEVAKALETLGRCVDQLIVVDSYQKTATSDLEGRSVEEDIDALMQANQENPYLQMKTVRAGIVHKMSAYYSYHVNLINTGQICAQIHMIKSETRVVLPTWMSTWAHATTSSYLEHQGYGKHDEMLHGAPARLNGELIGRILRDTSSNERVNLI